ncbi:hypothetical protein BKA66DRAFT_447694 [Pyrenochaeta sp. MPI-SDFR-AT-0127]|nr:hypothetical protein BKA66DRAFT_447694 [Pyrenochaeta sp. MPI-SDFR-AT-0127]
MHAQVVPLPSLGDAIELIESYFNALHITMPFLRKKDVFQQLERLYSDSPPYSGLEKSQDLFQLHMIFAIGCLRNARRRKDHKATDHYATAMGKDAFLVNIPAYKQVQNMLLVFVFATHHDVGIANTWEISRQTMRICVEFGLHSRTGAENNVLREQLRRRIFWSVYIADRFGSQNLDRPVAIQEEDITIELPINQHDEQLEAGNLEEPELFTEVSTLIRHVLLRRLGTNARTALSAMKASSFPSRSQVAKDWNHQLQAWYDSSIVKNTPTNAYETNEYLDINFHRERMKILSYLVLPIGTQDYMTSVADLWQYMHSAHSILAAYQRQSKDGHLILNWTCVQDALKCGFGILYCATSIPDQRQREGTGPGLLRSELDAFVAALQMCGDILSHITAQWYTVRRHANAFQQMSEAVLNLIARSTRIVTREQTPHVEHQSLDPSTEEIIQWDFDALDATLQLSNTAFTDADWAELFSVDPIPNLS